MDARKPSIGLILTGGGARAAYQVGVLSGVLDILDPQHSHGFPNPFPIICGTSAGAINAAALACRANAPHEAAERLRYLWENIHTDMVYRADPASLFRNGLQWLGMLALGWALPTRRGQQPHSLLDNQPLSELLSKSLDFGRLGQNLERGCLEALAITAAAYISGEHLIFYQSNTPLLPWTRSLRRAIPSRIGVDHLLASSAIPFVFPAQALLVQGACEWCGDGSMRQLAPLSPAIHLGATKVFVIGTGHRDDTHAESRRLDSPYPSLAQISGNALSNIFLDGLSMDVERLERINELLYLLPSDTMQSQSLRPITTFAITPSRSLDELALEHLDEMPRAARTLFRVLGVSSGSGTETGGALVSYLLFEASYTQALIQLGRTDSMKRTEEVKAFFKETQ
jgi:NTE family protein